MSSLDETLQDLADPDPERRKGAAWWLGEFYDPRAVEPLIAALHDQDADVRGYAAAGLATMKDSRAVEPLLERLMNDDNIYVKAASIGALGEIADNRAISALENIVETDPLLRAIAITALRKLDYPAFGNKALEFLRDGSQTEEVYQASMTVIGKLRLEEGVAAVEPFLRSDLGLARDALITLAKIGSPSAKEAIERNFAYLSKFDQEIAQRILAGKFILD